MYFKTASKRLINFKIPIMYLLIDINIKNTFISEIMYLFVEYIACKPIWRKNHTL